MLTTFTEIRLLDLFMMECLHGEPVAHLTTKNDDILSATNIIIRVKNQESHNVKEQISVTEKYMKIRSGIPRLKRDTRPVCENRRSHELVI